MRTNHRAALDSPSRLEFRLTCVLSLAAVTWLSSQLAFAQHEVRLAAGVGDSGSAS